MSEVPRPFRLVALRSASSTFDFDLHTRGVHDAHRSVAAAESLRHGAIDRAEALPSIWISSSGSFINSESFPPLYTSITRIRTAFVESLRS